MAIKLKNRERPKAESSKKMLIRKECTERKKKSTGKRKGSGFIPKSIYLHESSYNHFEELAKYFGYQLGTKGLSSEQLSMLVHFLLDAYKKTESACIPLTYDGHYLYRIHNILKYRSKTMRDTTKELAEFMIECKYPVPMKSSALGECRNNSKYLWTNQIAQSLLDKDLVNKQIEKLNREATSIPYDNELDAPFDDELDAPFDDELDPSFEDEDEIDFNTDYFQ